MEDKEVAGDGSGSNRAHTRRKSCQDSLGDFLAGRVVVRPNNGKRDEQRFRHSEHRKDESSKGTSRKSFPSLPLKLDTFAAPPSSKPLAGGQPHHPLQREAHKFRKGWLRTNFTQSQS